MVFKCKECGMEVERNKAVYPNYTIQHPLWLHLKQFHRPLYEMMCDFDNPYDIENLYDYNEDELLELYGNKRSDC